MDHANGISNDFDFEVGHWRVRHRRLKDRLVGCGEWEEFDGTSETRLVLGGNGNIEDNLIELPSGAYRAIAIRSFDAANRKWAIWWLASSDPHRLDVPVVGGFENGVGSFYAEDKLLGVPITVRFRWLNTKTISPRWEQAFSNDGGNNWETNWSMDFERQ